MTFTGFVTHSGRSSLVQKGCACYIYVLYLRESGIQVLLTMNRRLSWITFITWLESYVWTNMFPWNSRHNVWIGISFCLYFWSQFHFELLYALQKVGMLIYSWPVPVEWSPEGPVNGLLVDPVLLLHWNSAFGSCSYPHRPPSKSQVPDAANKHLFIYLFVCLFIYLFIRL